MKNIIIIFTGGTIAMRNDEQGRLIPAVSGNELIAAIPTIQKIASIKILQFSNLPSSQISPALMLALRHEIISHAQKEEVDGIIVVHGTDTLEETAFFLDASLSEEDIQYKPVVLTGAMRSNDQYSADGKANLLAAIQVAVDSNARGRGVIVAMNDEIHAARYIRKMDTSKLNAFQSPQYMTIGSSNTHGVRFFTVANRLTPNVNVSRETLELARVDIVNMYSGADSIAIDAFISAGAKAIVVQAVGASSVNIELYEAIEKALSKGVHIVIASRSPLGLCEPLYGYKGGGKTLEALGAIFSHDLPAHKARIYTQLLLSSETLLPEGFAKLTQNNWK